MKSENQKNLEGTARADRKRKTSAETLDKVPALPIFIKEIANDRQKKIFIFACRLLVEEKVLTKLDIVTVFNYAVALDVFLGAVKDLNDNERVQVYKSSASALSGYLNAYTATFRILVEQENKLGFNIYKRERMITFLDTEQQEELSAFDKLLNELDE